MTNAQALRPTAVKRYVGPVSKRTGQWAVIDQGIASAGTFLTFVLLARLLEPETYGRFALVFGALGVLNNFHGGLVIYPLMLRASAVSADVRRTCMEGLFTTILLTPPQLAVVFGACWFAQLAAGWPMAALFAWQCQETVRRTFTAQFLQAKAIPGDAISYLGQVALMVGFAQVSVLTLDGVFAVMASTSLLAAAIQAMQIGTIAVPAGELWLSARDFVHAGRWASITNILSVATPQVFLWTIALSGGAKNAGAFQALASVVNAINPVMFSMGHLVLPASARCMAEADIPGAIRISARYATQGAVLVAPFILALIGAPGAILSLIYGDASPYAQLRTSLRIFALYGCFAYLAHLAGSLLYGMGKSGLVCRAYLASAVVVVSSIPIVRFGGVQAAIVCLALTAMVRLVLHLRDADAEYRAAAQVSKG